MELRVSVCATIISVFCANLISNHQNNRLGSSMGKIPLQIIKVMFGKNSSVKCKSIQHLLYNKHLETCFMWKCGIHG